MRKVMTAVVLAGILLGCSDQSKGGSGGVTGTWHMDLEPLIEAQKGPMLAGVKAQAEMMRKSFDALPADQRDQAKAIAMKQIPEEQRGLLEALLAGEKQGAEMAEKMLREQMAGMKADLTINADGTFRGEFAAFGETDVTTGTWTMSGSDLTFTPKTKNGKPAEGDDAKTLSLKLEGGRLTGTKDGQTVSFKR